MKSTPPVERPLRLEYRTPAELASNRRNWRIHPPSQMRPLKAAIDTVGWAGALLYNEAPWAGHLVDGHARKQLAGKHEPIPVLIGSWTEDEERLILATLDPLAALAQIDKSALEDLISETNTDNDVLRDLLEKLAPPIAEPTVEEVQTGEVRDRFWIAIRGPLQHQALVLQRLREATKDLDDVEVELGSLELDL
ncbi:MAG: hypothetical protein Q8S13_07060 [Dehalococcoidia bacterium]|nr:hypothetical protein [Dehalococcoidia bacterium]